MRFSQAITLPRAAVQPLYRPAFSLYPQNGNLELQRLVNFSRPTIRHYWGADGLLKQAAAGELPISYDPVTGARQGWPIMGQWTNNILDPNDFTTSNWNKAGTTSVVANDTASPDGTQNADRIETEGQHDEVTQSVSIATNTDYTFVVHVKEGDAADCRIDLRVGGGTAKVYAYSFNFSSESLTALSDVADNTGVKNVGNGWYEIYLSANSNDNTNGNIQLYPDFTDDVGHTFFWGIGFFAGRSAPPPTPVFGEAAGQAFTQDPDIATITDLSWFNPDEGTILVEFKDGFSTKRGDLSSIFDLSDGSGDNRITVGATGSGDINFLFSESGSNPGLGGSSLQSGQNVAGISWDASAVSTSLNGSIIDDSVSVGGVPTGINILDIMRIGWAGRQTNGFIKRLVPYSHKFSNAQLQSLTS